jgi:hypothetical protein
MGGDLDVASVPGSGSTFVLALPGAAGADRDTVEAVLARATASEEVRLEERAVLNAIAESARSEPPVKLSRPKLVQGGGEGAPGSGNRRARLRTIDGTGSRPPGDPTPA